MFSLYDGEMFEGDIPLKEQQMIKEFVRFYQKRLIQMWEQQDFEKLMPVM